jgi:hypothetical protein
MACKCESLGIAAHADLLLPSQAYTPLPVIGSSGAEWTTPHYPPQHRSHTYGSTVVEDTTEADRGFYGSPEATPSAQKPFFDSMQFDVALPRENGAQPPRPLRRGRQSSWWRRIVNRSRRFARITYSTVLILILALWGVANVTFTNNERIHQKVRLFH